MNLYEKMKAKTETLKKDISNKSSHLLNTAATKVNETKSAISTGVSEAKTSINSGITATKDKVIEVKGAAVLKEYEDLIKEMSTSSKINLLSYIPETCITIEDFVEYCKASYGVELPINLVKYFFVLGLGGATKTFKLIPSDIVTNIAVDMASQSIYRFKDDLTLLLDWDRCVKFAETYLYMIIESLLTVKGSSVEVVEEVEYGTQVVKIRLTNIFDENYIIFNKEYVNRYLSDIAEINGGMEFSYIQELCKLLRHTEGYRDSLPTALPDEVSEIRGFGSIM